MVFSYGFPKEEKPCGTMDNWKEDNSGNFLVELLNEPIQDQFPLQLKHLHYGKDGGNFVLRKAGAFSNSQGLRGPSYPECYSKCGSWTCSMRIRVKDLTPDLPNQILWRWLWEAAF